MKMAETCSCSLCNKFYTYIYHNIVVNVECYIKYLEEEAALLFVDCVWNVMAHAQKPDLVFRAKRTSPFKSAGGRQFSRLLAAEVCASAVVMLDTPCSEVVWRVRATHSIRQFPLHFPSRASPCAITFKLESTCYNVLRQQQKTIKISLYNVM